MSEIKSHPQNKAWDDNYENVYTGHKHRYCPVCDTRLWSSPTGYVCPNDCDQGEERD